MEKLYLIAVGSAVVAAVGSIVIPRLCEQDFWATIGRLVGRLLAGWRR